MVRPTNKDSRYPYTYACDWLRMAGAAKSRGDACRLYDGYDEACTLADQYIIYWNLQQDAEDVLRHTKERLND
jgi:hypothetical protein